MELTHFWFVSNPSDCSELCDIVGQLPGLQDLARQLRGGLDVEHGDVRLYDSAAEAVFDAVQRLEAERPGFVATRLFRGPMEVLDARGKRAVLVRRADEDLSFAVIGDMAGTVRTLELVCPEEADEVDPSDAYDRRNVRFERE